MREIVLCTIGPRPFSGFVSPGAELLVQVAEYAPSQLAKSLSKDQLCELLRACSESDGQAKPLYASSLKKHEIAENLQSALIAVASSGSLNFFRVESLQMECFTLLPVQ